MNRTFGPLARAARDLGVSPDGHLLADFVARRDDGAFAQLVRRHGPMVLAVCRRVLRHQQDSEDAFQATFLVLARKADDVWPREAVGAWLHGVAYRVAMKARGVRARLARREHPLEDVPQTDTAPPCPDLAGVLDRAIRKLPEVYRAAVVACDLEGRSRKDAAEQLGWKEGTLSGRLSRARQLLAARLKKTGLAVPVGAVFTTSTADAVPAKLTDAVVRAALGSSAAGVSAPVAALTEGVVRSMFLVKTKTIAAAVFAACAMGLGVWSAAGQGTGGGAQPAKGERPRASGPSQPAGLPTDLDRMQGEWIIGRRPGGSTPLAPEPVAAAKADGSLVVVDGEHMTWPQVTASSSATTSGAGSPAGATATTDTVATTLTRYFLMLDPTQSPRHIDVVDPNGNVRKGIYKFEDGDLVICLNERKGRPKGFGDDERVKDDEPLWTLWQPRPPQPKDRTAPAAKPTKAAASDLDRMQRGEWIMGRPRLDTINGSVPKAVIESMIQSAKREGTLTVRDGKMMFWPQVGTTATSTTGEGGGTAGTTTTPTRTFSITLDPTQTPKHIDLTDDTGEVTKGIYLLEGQYFFLATNSIGGRPKDIFTAAKGEMSWAMWQPDPPEPKAAAPGPRVELAEMELDVLLQEIDAVRKQKTPDPNALDRLRARADAARRLLAAPRPPVPPAKPDPDLDELQGKWKVDVCWMNKADAGGPLPKGVLMDLEFTGDAVRLVTRDTAAPSSQRIEYTFTVDSSKSPKELDLFDGNKQVWKCIYEFVGGASAGGPPPELRLAVSHDGKRPAKIERRGRDGVMTFEMTKAEPADAPKTDNPAADERAKAETAKAQQHLELAELRSLSAAVELADAQARLAVARKTADKAAAQREVVQLALEEAKAKLAAAQKGNVKALAPATCTLHIRTLLAAEKVETIKLTGNETVLDVISKSVDVKLRNTASMWIVRGGDALTIDWTRLTQWGEATSNYQIKRGDQVFVQVNVAK